MVAGTRDTDELKMFKFAWDNEDVLSTHCLLAAGNVCAGAEEQALIIKALQEFNWVTQWAPCPRRVAWTAWTGRFSGI